MARSRELRVQIVGDTRGFNRALDTAGRQTRRFGDDAERSSKRVSTAFKGMALAAGSAGLALGSAGLALGFKKAIDEMRDSVKVSAQTEAVLKSTGGAANVTTKELERLAERLSMVAGMDDEVIQRTENLLLTFTRIRNETGRGNQIFSQATVAITDMAAAMAAAGGNKMGAPDLKSATIQVGKALQDPIRGITALRRVGVTFTDQQQEQIKTLVESGRQLDAQKMILRELRKEFGGSARANADSMDRLKVAVDNLFERLGKALAPALEDVTQWLVKFVRQMQNGKGAGGDFAQAMKNIAKVVGQTARGFADMIGWIRRAVRNVDAWGDSVRVRLVNAWRAVQRVFGNVMAGIFRHFARLFDLASHIPGKVGDKFDDAQRAAERAARSVDRLGENVKKLKSKSIKVQVDLLMKDFMAGDVPQLVPLPGGGPSGGPDSVRGRIESGAKSRGRQWALDNIDRIAPLLGAPGGQGASLERIRQIGLAMGTSGGLGSGQGFRPRDPGWHGKNRAQDHSGTAAVMMRFARTMFSMFGSRLKELIYSPMRIGIKNGQPVNILDFYGSDVYRDHFDHVHAALQKGGKVPGQGTGDKVMLRALVEPGEEVFVLNKKAAAVKAKLEALNAAVPRFQKGGFVARAARGAGFSGDLLRTMVAIARAESGWNPAAVGDGGNSIGLWQIHLPSHPWARGLNLTNPGVNAGAAMRVYRSQGLGAWSVYNSGAYQAWLGEAGAAIAGSGRGGGTQEDDPGWNWVTMGNKRRGVYLKGERKKRIVSPAEFARLDAGGRIDWQRTERSPAGDRYARTELPRRGTRTTPGIIGTRQDIRHERDWEALGDIREDDVVTEEERAQADTAYLARAKVLTSRIKAKRERLRKINRALRGRLRPATRERLLAEKATLISDIGGLKGEIRSLTGEFQDIVAPFDTDTGDGGGGESDPALEEANRLQEEANRLQEEANRLQAEHIATVAALKESIDRQNQFAESVAGIGQREALKAFADSISGQMGGQAGQRARSAGDGMTGVRY